MLTSHSQAFQPLDNRQSEKFGLPCSMGICPRVGMGTSAVSWFSSRAFVQLILNWKTWPYIRPFCVCDLWIVRTGKQSHLVSEARCVPGVSLSGRGRTATQKPRHVSNRRHSPEGSPGGNYKVLGSREATMLTRAIWWSSARLGGGHIGWCLKRDCYHTGHWRNKVNPFLWDSGAWFLNGTTAFSVFSSSVATFLLLIDWLI